MRITDRNRIAGLRLSSQQIVASELGRAAEVATRMLAMQAQDLAASKWALAVRSPGTTIADVDRAFDEGEIVRSWPFRGTLHVTPAADLGWMLALTNTRTIRGATTRHAELGLTDDVFARAADVVRGSLRGGARLSRADLFSELTASGIETDGQRGGHIIWYLAHTGLICLGPTDGSGQAIVLADEWISRPRELSREAALTELAVRYFTSHGPATLRDLLWWSKLLVPDARAAVDGARDHLREIVIDGTSYFTGADQPDAPTAPPQGVVLLPGFDEYLLGYENRDAVLPPQHKSRVVPGSNGVFFPMVVVRGQIVGTWRRTIRREAVDTVATVFTPLGRADTARFERACIDYARYLGAEPGSVTVAPA